MTARQRLVQIHRRRRHLAPVNPGSAHLGGPVRPHRTWSCSPIPRFFTRSSTHPRSAVCIGRGTPEKVGSESIRTAGCGDAVPISPVCGSIPRTKIRFTSPTFPPTAPPMEATVLPPSRERPEAMTITPSGSIRKTADHRSRRRSGSDYQCERRPDLEFLVQPADRAVLPRHHRQSISVLGVWRTTGERKCRYGQPQRHRRNHVSRLVSRRR